jgi:thiol:disulfide interchange protein
MVRLSQIRYGSRESLPSANPIARVIATLFGLVILAVSIFLGAIFIAGIIGMALIGGIVIVARAWFLRRKMQAYARDHGDLEAEYTVIREDVRRRDQTPGD